MNLGKKSVYGKVLADVSDIGRSHSKNDTSHLFTTELRRTMYTIIIVEMYVDMPTPGLRSGVCNPSFWDGGI